MSCFTCLFFLPPLEYKFPEGRDLALFTTIYSALKLCLLHSKRSVNICSPTGIDRLSSYMTFLEHLPLMNIFFLMLPPWLLGQHHCFSVSFANLPMGCDLFEDRNCYWCIYWNMKVQRSTHKRSLYLDISKKYLR